MLWITARIVFAFFSASRISVLVNLQQRVASLIGRSLTSEFPNVLQQLGAAFIHPAPQNNKGEGTNQVFSQETPNLYM